MQPLKKLTSAQYNQFYVTGIWLLLLCIVQTACTSYSHTDLVAQGFLSQNQIATSLFRHRLFARAGHAGSDRDRLHIYIEGDGRPWRRRDLVATDPTSPEPMMLKLMLGDTNQSVYLGRPCYYQVEDPRCSPLWWTFHRYHPDVVNSMVEAVSGLAEGYKEVTLIGHSGGGTLAVLAGRRLARPVTVITINPNLDHAAWTSHHGFTPLAGSLNPMEDRARNPSMREVHWIGDSDTTVLPEWSLAYCVRFQVRCMRRTAGHTDGWLEEWDSVLKQSAEVHGERS